MGTDFRPTTRRDTLYNDILVDLPAYTGTITFASNCKYSQLTNIKNCNLIDDVKVNIGDLNAPVINSISQFNSLCTPQDRTVVAEITDNVAVSEAKLFYSGNNGASWIETTMALTGTAYLGNIPAFTGKVLYYVKAKDAAENEIISNQLYIESGINAGNVRTFTGNMPITDAYIPGIT